MDIVDCRDLRVYKNARAAANEIFRLSAAFPRSEMFGLTSQIRRSSRSVRANLVEAWRRRRSAKYFLAKLNDAQTEAAETQEWLITAIDCHYIDDKVCNEHWVRYEQILGQLGAMAAQPEKWVSRGPRG